MAGINASGIGNGEAITALSVIMNKQQWQRYARQIKLPQVGENGQQRLLDSRVLIIGMGGLGSPAAMYLAAAGVGHLVISDFDRVDESNLQRQIIHAQADIHQSKASSAKHTLLALNPALRVDAIDHELDGDELAEQMQQADLVLDCTDNFASRFNLNRHAIATATPLVSGAAIRFQGQIATFDPRQADCPCYRCLYPDENIEAASCAAQGVIAPIVGVVGSMQALEALNILLDTGQGIRGRLLLFDAVAMDWQSVVLPKNPNCPDCGNSSG